MIRRATGRGPARGRRRGGFTLLEVLLSTLIASMVLAALYVGFNLTLQQAQTVRDAVESEDLSRGVFNKFALDFNGTFAPLAPKSGGNTAASGGGTASSTGTTGTSSTASTGTGAGASTGSSAASTGSSTTSGSSSSTTTTATTNTSAFLAAPAFQGGVYCQDPTTLILFLGRTPESFTRHGDPNPQQPRDDLRQVVYKFVSGRGLFRSEQPWVLASGLTLDLDPDADGSVLLAGEVSGVVFEFTDGTSGEWQTSWDGTVPGPDGVTPLGPPRAVRVTLTLPIAGASGQQTTKNEVHVFVIRTAPGTNTPTMLEAPTAGASSGGSSGSSGSKSSTASSGSSTPSTGTSGTVTGANASGGSTTPSTGSTSGASGTSGAKTGGTMTGGASTTGGTGGTGGGR